MNFNLKILVVFTVVNVFLFTANRIISFKLHKIFKEELDRFKAENARLREALESISKNSCCHNCREEGLVVCEALKAEKPKCIHPHNGNMCLQTDPGEKCENCSCYGYND